ncbi:TXK kinase, partial [Corythaeola cristata]|nr:TXK kinase [Corythaeola cristata]
MFLFADHTIQSVFCCCCCCCTVQKRAMRTKMNLDPDTGLVTQYQYSASQPDISYASTWKRRRKRQLQLKNKPLPPLPAEALEDYTKKPRVIALYDFFARGPLDLTLKKSEEYIILEQYDPHWWKARDQHGTNINFYWLKLKDRLSPCCRWYCKNINRSQAELLLRQKVTQLIQ